MHVCSQELVGPAGPCVVAIGTVPPRCQQQPDRPKAESSATSATASDQPASQPCATAARQSSIRCSSLLQCCRRPCSRPRCSLRSPAPSPARRRRPRAATRRPCTRTTMITMTACAAHRSDCRKLSACSARSMVTPSTSRAPCSAVRTPGRASQRTQTRSTPTTIYLPSCRR
jgi:hypothetical protein